VGKLIKKRKTKMIKDVKANRYKKHFHKASLCAFAPLRETNLGIATLCVFARNNPGFAILQLCDFARNKLTTNED
jgi:hypothetical protein